MTRRKWLLVCLILLLLLIYFIDRQSGVPRWTYRTPLNLHTGTPR